LKRSPGTQAAGQPGSEALARQAVVEMADEDGVDFRGLEPGVVERLLRHLAHQRLHVAVRELAETGVREAHQVNRRHPRLLVWHKIARTPRPSARPGAGTEQ